MTALRSSLEDISSSVTLIQEYRSSDFELPTLNQCSGFMVNNISGTVIDISESIKGLIYGMNNTLGTGSMVDKSKKYKNVTKNFIDIRGRIHELKFHVEQLLHTLDTVNNGSINNETQLHIESLSCLSDLHLIDLTLNNCTKIDNGLSCEFLVNVSTNPINYEHYLPVIYDGVSVELPRDHILVKAINSDEMGLINCTVTELSIVNFCTFKTWDPAKHLFETDPILAIENNNFIFIDTSEPQQLPDQSVLIMDNDYNIALKSDNDTELNLTNLSPFILSFYKDSSLTLSTKKLNFSFKGSLNDNVTITQISIFNLTTIEYMHAKARYYTFGILHGLR